MLMLLNAFFTLAETALVTVRNVRLSQMVAEGSAHTGTAAKVQSADGGQPTRVVATVQVGITLASFAVAALAAAVLAPDMAARADASASFRTPCVCRVSVVVTDDGGGAGQYRGGGDCAAFHCVPQAGEDRAWRWRARLRFFMTIVRAAGMGIALGLSSALVRPFGLAATFATPVITEEELQDAFGRFGAVRARLKRTSARLSAT